MLRPDRVHRAWQAESVMPRIPTTAARRLGLTRLIDLAADEPLILTRWGHPAAVIGSAEWMDEAVRTSREAALTVLDAAADLVAQRSQRHSLDEVCARLGVDAGVVRRRAAQRAEE